MTEEVPAVARAANAVCASDIVDTVISPILMSQAPFMRDCHRGILAAEVLGAIPPRISRPFTWARQRPAVRCQAMSSRQRSRTSLNASWYKSGDMYINAILLVPILYSDTISEAVRGGASGLDQTLAAATAIGHGNAVSRKGRGVFRQEGGTNQRVAFNLGNGSGGQGAGRGGIPLCATSSSEDLLSVSRPRSYRSCAAGG